MATDDTNGSKWSRQADLTVAGATLEAYGKETPPSAKVNGSGTAGTMGYWCHYDAGGTTERRTTEPFPFPVIGDLTIVINATAVDFGSADTIDLSMQGSMNGTAWTELADETALIQDSTGTVEDVVLACVYDYDAKGRMPYMRLAIQANATSANNAILIGVVPH